MAKTYLSTVKYEVLANYEVQGVVEKPDIVGAIFGQSEGLLGEDMDLKELQQSGKLGRIEITVEHGKGTTFGNIIIPSSLDQIKTSILGATIETVEKVGPCEAKVKVVKITDTRKEKRGTITERAKELLKTMQKFEGVESIEMASEIREDVRAEKVVDFKGLTAGPDVATAAEIVIVEGRADVLKLLGYGINNAVAMNGSNITPALIDLCKEKTVVMLVDGDRGGELNAKKLASLTKVDFVAVAPDGKEVEELTQKEILQSLKRRQTFADYNAGGRKEESHERKPFPPRYNDRREGNFNGGRGDRRGFDNRDRRDNNFGRERGEFGEGHMRPRFDNRREFNDRQPYNREGQVFGERQGRERMGFRESFNPRDSRASAPMNQPRERGFVGGFERTAPAVGSQPSAPVAAPAFVASVSADAPQEILDMKKDFDKLRGKLKAKLLDSKNKKIKEVDVKDLLTAVQSAKKKVHTIMFDGIVTNRLVEAAEAKEVATIIGVKKGTIKESKINIYTL